MIKGFGVPGHHGTGLAASCQTPLTSSPDCSSRRFAICIPLQISVSLATSDRSAHGTSSWWTTSTFGLPIHRSQWQPVSCSRPGCSAPWGHQRCVVRWLVTAPRVQQPLFAAALPGVARG